VPRVGARGRQDKLARQCQPTEPIVHLRQVVRASSEDRGRSDRSDTHFIAGKLHMLRIECTRCEWPLRHRQAPRAARPPREGARQLPAGNRENSDDRGRRLTAIGPAKGACRLRRAERPPYEYEYTPAFAKRQRLLSPEQYEVVDLSRSESGDAVLEGHRTSPPPALPTRSE
jgi:hypothetical protein